MPDRPADRRKDERAAALRTGPGQSWRQHRPIAPKKKPNYERPPGFAQRMMISQQIIGKGPLRTLADIDWITSNQLARLSTMRPANQGKVMQRRRFITLIGAATVASPFSAQAQLQRIGVLLPF